MKICYLADGSSIHVVRWLEWFQNRGHEICLIAQEAPALEGVETIRVPIKKGYFIPRPRMLSAIRKAIRRTDPDIVHAHSVLGYGMYAALSKFHPLVVSAWGSDITVQPQTSLLVRQTCRFVLRRADLIHVGEPGATSTVGRLGGVGAVSKCLVLPWGVDTAEFSAIRRSEELRASICPPDHTLFVADRHLEPIYRHEVLIRAVREVAKRTDRLVVAVAGSGSSAPALQEEGRRAGVMKVVKFLGEVPPREMARWYASSDVYVECFASQMPGHGVGLSILEAMASGLPVLAARRPALEGLVKDGVNGFLFDGERSGELADLMLRFVEDPSIVGKMGAAAARSAADFGDREKTLRIFEQRMADLAGARS